MVRKAEKYKYDETDDLYHVVIPTLTVFPPDHTLEIGRAVFIFLPIDHEGNDGAKWLASEHSVGMYLYAKGEHGFRMKEQHQPSDRRIDRFGDGLALIGMLLQNHS